MIKNLLVFGCGGHAKVIIDLIELVPDFRVAGLIDDDKNRVSHFQGYPVLGDVSCLKNITEPFDGGVIAIGDNWSRKLVAEKIKKIDKDFHFITIIHPAAYTSPRCRIGVGTVVMAGAIVNTDVQIGEHCIVNTLGSVAHDCIMRDFSSIGPGAHLGGHAIIGKNSAVSLGARVLHGITIGDHTVIGAGSTVTKNISHYTVAYGTPAKFVRTRVQEESYL